MSVDENMIKNHPDLNLLYDILFASKQVSREDRHDLFVKVGELKEKISDLKKDLDRQFWRYVELEKVHNRFVEQTLSRLNCETDIKYERTFKSCNKEERK